MASLFHRDDRRIRELEEQLKEARRLADVKDRFFASMSHEIRTPIHTILGSNELMLRSGTLPKDRLSDARNIESAGKLLLALINDILDFSKLEAGQMVIVPSEYEISAVISDIVGMLWSKADEKGLAFRVDADPSLPARLIGDELRIRQILINLLNNAIKYTSNGEVSLHLESTLKDEESGRVLLMMTVTDTGMGIKKEDLPHLFDAFSRTDLSKNKHIEGTGLGLSIVRQLVELMDGEIRVNSVYGQGSVFSVILPQQVEDTASAGEIQITGRDRKSEKEEYIPGFLAPEAAILVVDDNRINAEVEARLLEDTRMRIDLADSGPEALSLSLKNHYDVIFMDHLMPGMDGIECLGALRRHEGGLNKQTPVIALTANAGSEDQKLYRMSGFDSCISKPVDGAAMEDTLIRFIPAHKLTYTGRKDAGGRLLSTAKGYHRMQSVVIATSSISDLPPECTGPLGIDIIPFLIHTEGGTFTDGEEAVPGELIRYMTKRGRQAKSEPPSVEEYERFFAGLLRRTVYVIFIALSSKAGREYERALQASQTFENVTVFDSGNLSSGVGILVLAAYQMARQEMSVDDIIKRLEVLKTRINCTFVIDTTEFMLKMGNISERVHMFANALMLHPSLRMKNGRLVVSRVWAGSKEHAWEAYLKETLAHVKRADFDYVFVTYVGLSEEEKGWIEEEIKKRSSFRRIIFKHASATIALNCGPGTFGLLFVKDARDAVPVGALLQQADSESEEVYEPPVPGPEKDDAHENVKSEADESMLLHLDEASGIKNCGSRERYESALRMFYEAAEAKQRELSDALGREDWEDYTIRVHALKSSSAIIGAAELSGMAFSLETAGKEGRYGAITAEHGALIKEYEAVLDELSGMISHNSGSTAGDAEERSRPMADSYLIEGALGVIRDAADDMEIEAIREAFAELEGYSFSDEQQALFDEISHAADIFDYDEIISCIDKYEIHCDNRENA